MNKKIGFTLGVIILLVITILIFRVTNSAQDQNLSKDTSTTPISSPVTVPKGWKSHEIKGVMFGAPETFAVETNGEYSVLAIPKENNQYKVGNARFFYVTVIPNNMSNDELGNFYNYNATFHNKLLSIPVGEIRNLSDLDGQKDWYTYERAGDENINGETAKVFINQRPWEFPHGTWEYRYIFELPEQTVLAGAYIDGGLSDAEFTLPLLQEIIKTIEIK